MYDRHRVGQWTLAVLFALATCMAGSPSFSQDSDEGVEILDLPGVNELVPAEAEEGPPSEPNIGSAMIIAVEMKANAKEKQLRSDFELRLRPTNLGFSFGNVGIRELTRREFDVLTSVARGDLASGVFRKPALLVPRPESTRQWDIQLNPEHSIEELLLTYRDGVGRELQTKKYLEPASATSGPTEATEPLQKIEPGIYLLTIEEASWIPVKCEVKVSDSKSNPPNKIAMAQSFPETNKYFLVQLENFQGNGDSLFSALRDRKYFNNPIRSATTSHISLWATSFRSVAFEDSLGVIQNTVIMTKRPEGRDIDRIWMLFPLTHEEVLGISDKLNNKSPTDIEMIELIHEGKEGKTLDHETIPDILTTPLSPEQSPYWCEMIKLESLGGATEFVHKYDVENVAAWRQHPTYTREAYRVVVYERTPENGPVGAILTRDELSGDECYWRIEKVDEWSGGIDEVGRNEEKMDQESN